MTILEGNPAYKFMQNVTFLMRQTDKEKVGKIPIILEKFNHSFAVHNSEITAQYYSCKRLWVTI